jgi:hypothetical protein
MIDTEFKTVHIAADPTTINIIIIVELELFIAAQALAGKRFVIPPSGGKSKT